MAKQNRLTGKFIVAFDTLCDGWQCAKDENDKPDPTLHESEADAMVDLFEDAFFMLENQTDADRKENGISKKTFAQMKKIFNDGDGDAMQMTQFLEAHPECNYNAEFIVPAEEFLLGRKAIFGKDGLVITGTKLK